MPDAMRNVVPDGLASTEAWRSSPTSSRTASDGMIGGGWGRGDIGTAGAAAWETTSRAMTLDGCHRKKAVFDADIEGFHHPGVAPCVGVRIVVVEDNLILNDHIEPAGACHLGLVVDLCEVQPELVVAPCDREVVHHWIAAR